MQAKSNLAVFGLVLVFAFPFAGQRTFGAATTRGGSVGTVLRALFANYAAIKTVAFRAELTAGPVASGKASWKPEIVARYTFFAKGISYRELYLVARPHTLRSLDCLTAFDGKRFEFLYLPSQSLSISKAPPAGDSNPDMPNPLVLPLMFLSRLRCCYYSMATGQAGLVRIALHQNLILESSGFAVSMRFRPHKQIRPEFLHPTALDAGIGCGV